MRNLRAIGAVLALIGVAAMLLFAAASPAAKSKKVFWIDLSGQAAQHPDFVYFTANSGGQVHDLSWTNWGGKKAVGEGIFEDTSPSFPGKPDTTGPARITARMPVTCTPEFGSKKGKKIRVYRHVKLRYPDGSGGTNVADVTDRAGWTLCKESD